MIVTIDMGSNAIRMMIAEKIDQNGQPYQILKKQRAQLRLGHDVFENGHITPPTMQGAKRVLLDFKQIIQNYSDCKVICAATSATREAKIKKSLLDFSKYSPAYLLDFGLISRRSGAKSVQFLPSLLYGRPLCNNLHIRFIRGFENFYPIPKPLDKSHPKTPR